MNALVPNMGKSQMQSKSLGEFTSEALSPQIIIPHQQPSSEVYFTWKRENKTLECNNSEDAQTSMNQFRNILPHEQFT